MKTIFLALTFLLAAAVRGCDSQCPSGVEIHADEQGNTYYKDQQGYTHRCTRR
jgi:hypothetical protein